MKLKHVLLLQAILVISAFNTKTNAANPITSTSNVEEMINDNTPLWRFFSEKGMSIAPQMTEEGFQTAVYVLFSGSYDVARQKYPGITSKDMYDTILSVWQVREFYPNSPVTAGQMKEMYRKHIASVSSQAISNVTDEALLQIASNTKLDPASPDFSGQFEVSGFTQSGVVMVAQRVTAYVNEKFAYFPFNGTKVYYASTGCGNPAKQIRRVSTPGGSTQQFDYAKVMFASNDQPNPNNTNVTNNINVTVPNNGGNGQPFFIQSQPQVQQQQQITGEVKVKGMTALTILTAGNLASNVLQNVQTGQLIKLQRTSNWLQMLTLGQMGNNNNVVVQGGGRWSNRWPVQNGGGGGGYVNQGGFQGNSDPYNWYNNTNGNYGNGNYGNGGYYNNNYGNQYGNQWGTNPQVYGVNDQLAWYNSMNQQTAIRYNQDQQLMYQNGGVLPVTDGLGTSRFRQSQPVYGNNGGGGLLGILTGGGQSYGNSW